MNQQILLQERPCLGETSFLTSAQMGIVMLAWRYDCTCVESVFVEAYKRHFNCPDRPDFQSRWEKLAGKNFMQTGEIPSYVVAELAQFGLLA